MKTLNGISSLSHALSSSVVTIGNFDGLHLGHQALVSKVMDLSQKFQVPSVVFTFDPHPLEILAPEVGHLRIFSKEDLQQQLEWRGLDYLVVEPFSLVFAKTPPEKFVLNFLKKPLNPKALVVGHDFAFGEKRGGTLEVLGNLCDQYEIQLCVVDPVVSDGPVSSSRIRQSIRLGQMQDVQKMLGRPYYVSGLVVRGDGRGKTIGVPTINLQLFSDIQPAPGVYVTSVKVDEKWLPSVSNIGCKPTFQKDYEQKVFTVETHILNFNQDVYGRNFCIQFHSRLRGETKFSGVEELVQQINKDIAIAENWFRENPL